MVVTQTQKETDRYWDAIVGNGGSTSACGWCKDRWGFSWQITPRRLLELMTSSDQVEAKRVFEAMMTTVKIDTAALEAAVKRKQRSTTVSYIDGFVIAVPTANKQKFIDHAKLGDGVFMDLGATRILECWGDDVADGKLTDFRKAVQAKDDETIVFSWIEWPDKATRDAAHSKMVEWMQHPEKADPRMHPEKNPMPFDGKRLIFGGFTPLVELESSSGIKASS